MTDEERYYSPQEEKGEDREEEEYYGEEVEEWDTAQKSPPAIRVRYPSCEEGEELGFQYAAEYVGEHVLQMEEGAWSPQTQLTPSSSVLSVQPSEESEEDKEAREFRESRIQILKEKLTERQGLRRRNGFLQKKLVEHFKRRRLEHVFEDDTQGLDQDSKYLKKLFAFQDFMASQEEEMFEITDNMARAKKHNDDLDESVNVTLTKLTQRMKEFALPLHVTKTGRKLNERAVERLLSRQTILYEELGKRRLKFIKIKNLIEDKMAELQGLDHVGNGLMMIDYQKMRADIATLSDKMDERSDELSSVRTKVVFGLQVLSNIKLKTQAVEEDIETMADTAWDVNHNEAAVRTTLTISKKRRNLLREELGRLRLRSGLLTKDTLLRDFKESIDEAEAVASDLLHLQMQSKARKEKIKYLSKGGRKQSHTSRISMRVPPDEVEKTPTGTKKKVVRLKSVSHTFTQK